MQRLALEVGRVASDYALITGYAGPGEPGVARSANKPSSLVDEPLARACSCSVCGGVVVLGALMLVHRDEPNRMIGRACAHLYCRVKLRESFMLISDPDAGYVN